jgi:type I restriction enzyme R subunit
VQIYDPEDINDPPLPPDEEGASIVGGPDGFPEGQENDGEPEWEDDGDGLGGDPPPVKRYVVSNVKVMVAAERVQYFDVNGQLVTESLKDYTRKAILQQFDSLDAFLTQWSSMDKKEAIIEELIEQGIFLDALAEEVGKDLDPFDLICHVAWDRPPLTRKERVENVQKKDYFAKYGDKARQVLQALLDKYADQGIIPLENPQILRLNPFDQMGTPMEIAKEFGGLEAYQQALAELEKALYSA